jgi:hypothetical protein
MRISNIKYKIFNAIPIESQMLMLVATSAYICNNKNKKKGEIEQYLNQPANIDNNIHQSNFKKI